MKHLTILASIIIYSQITIAQQSKNINFIFPDAVEVFIDSCLSTNQKLNDYLFYLSLKRDSVYKLTIGKYRKHESGQILPWINQTSRFAVINKRLVPLILDYDSEFATINPNDIGEFGKRDGKVKRIRPILHGTSIFFNSEGVIIKTVDW